MPIWVPRAALYSLPAEMESITPEAAMFSNTLATSSSPSGVLKPQVEPKLILMTSTPRVTASSAAARISSQVAPLEPLELNTFMARIRAWGAMPTTSSTTPALPAAMPATWVPWSPALPGFTSRSLSA